MTTVTINLIEVVDIDFKDLQSIYFVPEFLTNYQSLNQDLLFQLNFTHFVIHLILAIISLKLIEVFDFYS